jgi:hypothetical protein
MKRNELKQQILHILRKIPETRDSDITLMIDLWKEFYPSYIKKNSTGDLAIFLPSLYKLPSQDNIKRIRAVIQNEEGILLPTSWIVAKKRKISEIEWREYFNRTNEHIRI